MKSIMGSGFATILTAALLCAAAAGFPAVQGSKTKRPKTATAPESALKPAMVPFRVGETLTYRVIWSAFSNAASIQLSIPEQRNLFGWNTWHFRAAAHTQSPVRSLFAIDDQFDSYTDASMQVTRQYEMHLNELGKSEDDTLHFAPAGQTTHAPPPLSVVEPGTRDPLGVVYVLRSIDWKANPELHAPVYDGRQLYQIVAKREAASETLKLGAGSFDASRIGVQVLQDGKEMSSIHFTVWMSNDGARTPVMFQATLPFGSIKAELTSAQ